MSKIDKNTLDYTCKQDKNYIGFKNVKALFQTKIVEDMKYNGKI